MKKILSVLLTIVILLSAICPSLVFAADTNSLDWQNTDNWLKNASNSKNIGTNEGAVAYTGTGITKDDTTFIDRGTTLKLDSDALRVSLPLGLKENINYRLTFSYYTDAVTTVTEGESASLAGNTYAIKNTGIFIPNHPNFEGVSGDRLGFAYTMSYLNIYAMNYQMNTPAGHLWTVNASGGKTGFADQNFDGVADKDARTFKPMENFHGIEAGKWYTLSFDFNSRTFKDIAFTLQKIAGANMWLDDIVLKDLSEPENDASDYFEDPDNWVLSLTGSAANRRNISVDGTDGTYFSGEKGGSYHAVDNTASVDAGGSSLKLKWATHASNIAVPNVEKGKSYRLKFSYKVVTSSGLDLAKKQLVGIGVYSPKAMDDAIAAGDTASYFFNGTVGWNVYDLYNGADGVYRYRDETLKNCTQTANRYAHTEGDYTYAAANQWYTSELYFKATDYTDLYLVILPGDDNKGGMLLDNFEFEEVEKVPDSLKPTPVTPPGPEPEDPTEDWIFNASNSKNIGTNEGAVAYEGTGMTLDKTTFQGKETFKLDNGDYRVSLPLKTEANKNYKFTFSYYTDTVSKTSVGNASDVPYAITNTGIFIPNHPDFEGISGDRINFAYTMTYLNYYGSNVQMNTPAGHNWNVKADGSGNGYVDGDKRTYKQVENYHNIEANKWYTLSFEFNSADFKDIAFTLKKLKGNMWLSDVKLEEVQSAQPEPTPTPGGADNYFETPANWNASIAGSKSSPCKNILVNGISDTTVATAITWAKFTNTSTTESGSGSSLLINNPNHVSHIKLPDIKAGETYRIKFAYKPQGGQAGSSVLRLVGIFDPEFTQSKITADSNSTYSDLKTGFVAVDAYSVLKAGRYRFENGLYANDSSYGSLNENIYDESTWRTEEIYFKAETGLDNLYLLISYTTEAKTLLVDSFEFEKVDKIPDEHMPGWVDPNYKAPEQTVIDFEGEASKYSHLLIKDSVSLDTTKGHNKKDTQALHINEVREQKSNVTYPGWSTVSAMQDPVFTFPVEPNTMYSISYWMKVDKAEYCDYRLNTNLIVFHDWRGTTASSLKKEYKYNEIQVEPYDWVEYTLEFLTQPGQTTATFAINANYWHPSFWIDDITYTKVPAGYKSETTLSYCESPYNIVKKENYAASGTLKTKTVMEMDVNINDQFVYGINVSGKGKFTLSWDKDGKDIIRSYNVSDIKERIGATIITGAKHNKIYAIFEPADKGITYKDFYLFKRFSIGTGREMGYEENINARVPLRFTNIPTVSGNSIDDVYENLAMEEEQNDEDTSSPSTGDSLTVVTLLTITLAISAAAVLLLGKKEKAK